MLFFVNFVHPSFISCKYLSILAELCYGPCPSIPWGRFM